MQIINNDHRPTIDPYDCTDFKPTIKYVRDLSMLEY